MRKKQVWISGTLTPAELNVQIFPVHRNGDDALLAPFIQPHYTEVGSGGYRKYFLKYTKFMWKQAFVRTPLIWKKHWWNTDKRIKTW